MRPTPEYESPSRQMGVVFGRQRDDVATVGVGGPTGPGVGPKRENKGTSRVVV